MKKMEKVEKKEFPSPRAIGGNGGGGFHSFVDKWAGLVYASPESIDEGMEMTAPPVRPRALGLGEAQDILAKYNQENSRGRRLYTLQGLAEEYGVGESTIHRVVNRIGPYRALKPARTKAELEEDVRALEALVTQRMLEGDLQTVAKADQAISARTNEALDKLLNKGKAIQNDPGLADRLAKVQAAKGEANEQGSGKPAIPGIDPELLAGFGDDGEPGFIEYPPE